MNPIRNSTPVSVRLIVPAILVITASLGIWQDLDKPVSNSVLCGAGFCREDQATTGLSYTRLDEGNPYKWADFAEALDAKGDTNGAEKAFQRALELGPAIAPVWMRAFNFHLIHDDSERLLSLGHEILTLTPAYNQLIFTDLVGIPVADILKQAIPPDTVPAYFAWSLPRRPTSEILTTWEWMVANKQTDEKSAAALTASLCARTEYATAARLWIAFLGPDAGGYGKDNLLFNPRFAREPLRTPFDWQISPVKEVETARNDGLVITFPGTVNLTYRNVRQLTPVRTGAYRFTADVEADGITTNEGLYFHIYDPDSRDSVDVYTDKLRGTVPRTTVEQRFFVPPGAGAVVIQLERQPSDRVDSKIAGTFRIHEMTLRRVE